MALVSKSQFSTVVKEENFSWVFDIFLPPLSKECWVFSDVIHLHKKLFWKLNIISIQNYIWNTIYYIKKVFRQKFFSEMDLRFSAYSCYLIIYNPFNCQILIVSPRIIHHILPFIFICKYVSSLLLHDNYFMTLVK